MKIEWQGYLTSNKLDANAEKGNKLFTPCQRAKPLEVLISGSPDVASNVVLNHVLANTFLTGNPSSTSTQANNNIINTNNNINTTTTIANGVEANNPVMNGILDSL